MEQIDMEEFGEYPLKPENMSALVIQVKLWSKGNISDNTMKKYQLAIGGDCSKVCISANPLIGLWMFVHHKGGAENCIVYPPLENGALAALINGISRKCYPCLSDKLVSSLVSLKNVTTDELLWLEPKDRASYKSTVDGDYNSMNGSDTFGREGDNFPNRIAPPSVRPKAAVKRKRANDKKAKRKQKANE